MVQADLNVLGWDIGGANLKAALVRHGSGGSRLQASWHLPYELWRGTSQLSAPVDQVLADCHQRLPIDAHAITMTGELVDFYPTRAHGVRAISGHFLEHLKRHHELPRYGCGFYAMPGCFIDRHASAAHADAVMSANWHATANWLSTELPDGLLLDVGSTTTDIVPWRAHRLRLSGVNDHLRLASAQLVYTGATRTPVMAIGSTVQINGKSVGVAAEYFATMGDVHRLTGQLPDASFPAVGADGRSMSLANCAARLARMVGQDRTDRPMRQWQSLARWIASQQATQLQMAVRRVVTAAGLPARAPIVVAGSGAFIGAALGRTLKRRVIPVNQFIDGSPRALARAGDSIAAWAVAVRAAATIARDLDAG